MKRTKRVSTSSLPAITPSRERYEQEPRVRVVTIPDTKHEEKLWLLYIKSQQDNKRLRRRIAQLCRQRTVERTARGLKPQHNDAPSGRRLK